MLFRVRFYSSLEKQMSRKTADSILLQLQTTNVANSINRSKVLL